MKEWIFVVILVALGCATKSGATAITGKLAIAGLDTYTSTGVTFTNPAVVLTSTDDLSVLPGTVPLNFNNIGNFSTEPSQTLFTWSDMGVTISMTINSLTVLTDSSNFLNVMGTATMSETGFDPTPFNFDFTSTRPDGTTSYTMDVSSNVVSEPGSLLLLATGLISMASLYRVRKRNGCRS